MRCQGEFSEELQIPNYSVWNLSRREGKWRIHSTAIFHFPGEKHQYRDKRRGYQDAEEGKHYRHGGINGSIFIVHVPMENSIMIS